MIEANESLLIVIDIQEKFKPALPDFDKVVANTVKLVRVFQLLEIPILVNEQYPRGLGQTAAEIKNELKEFSYVEKVSFDCFLNDSFCNILDTTFRGRKNLIICGIESHICVAQSVLSALSRGYEVHLAADAVASRKKSDYEIALRRMENEGAKIGSVEMLIFQMIPDSKHEHFKEISKIIR